MEQNDKNPKLVDFLTKLKDGRYTQIRYARSALGGTVGLSEEDKAEARAALEQYFNPKPKEKEAPPPKPISEVASLRNAFSSYKTALMASMEALFNIAGAGPYSDEDLTTLLDLSLEEGGVPAFVTLVQRFSAQISPSMLDMARIKHHPEFFRLVAAVFTSPSPRAELLHAMTDALVFEADRRSGDDVQVAAFEGLMEDLAARRPAGFDINPLTELVVAFATPRFILHWLKAHDDNPTSVHGFVHRMLALYLTDDTNAASLLALVDSFDLERPVLEEIVRVLLVQRQLGDALYFAENVDDEHKPALYQILHPVVVRHGDALALVAFNSAFRGMADKNEIKSLIKKSLKPDVDQRIDAVLEGVDPTDVFESVPTMIPPDQAARVRSDLMRDLGVPVREPRPQTGFLGDLLSQLRSRG